MDQPFRARADVLHRRCHHRPTCAISTTGPAARKWGARTIVGIETGDNEIRWRSRRSGAEVTMLRIIRA